MAYVTYEFSDSEILIHYPVETWGSGKHILSLYYPIDGLAVARSMLEEGAITEEEYRQIDTILLKKHRPILGTLLAGKPLQ